jgi:hypothetical protein
MVFIAIVITAIILYVRDFKISALFLFFFFVTSGFNLLPEEVTKFTFFSKGMDYAFLILIGIVGIEMIFGKGFLRPDNFTKYLILLGSFLLICMAYSKFALGLETAGIIRTSRYLFFWIAWFVFRSLEKEQLEMLLKFLFYATVVCALLYIFQIFLGESILNEGLVTKAKFLGMKFERYYNHPDMLYFFAFMAIFHNPLKGVLKVVTASILVAALLGAFHRSLTGFFFISLFLGYLFLLPRLKRMRIMMVTAIIMVGVLVFYGYKFVHSRTYTDVKNVISGNFLDVNIDITEMQESTFTFRMAHLLERNMYLQEHPRAMIIGAGLIPEDSKKIQSMFDFDIGLAEEITGQTVQVDTGDISYSMLLIRFGYLGTALILAPIFVMLIFFYKHKENKYALFALSHLVLVLGVSFFSANLANPVTFLMPMIAYHIVNKSNPMNKSEEDE